MALTRPLSAAALLAALLLLAGAPAGHASGVLIPATISTTTTATVAALPRCLGTDPRDELLGAGRTLPPYCIYCQIGSPKPARFVCTIADTPCQVDGRQAGGLGGLCQPSLAAAHRLALPGRPCQGACKHGVVGRGGGGWRRLCCY